MAPEDLFAGDATDATRLIWLVESEFEAWTAQQSEARRRWLAVQRIKPPHSAPVWLPPENADEHPSVLLIAKQDESFETLARAVEALPEGCFELAGDLPDLQAGHLGWALGGYVFDRYTRAAAPKARLKASAGKDLTRMMRIAHAIWLARDLINTPASDLLPSHLSEIAEETARQAGAEFRVTVGDALLSAGFGAIHAVGRASADPPRLIDITWGDPDHPKVTLVGKGVCFDSGGLDIKSAAGMKLMKKDMGGAAVALALAKLIIEQELPVRLRLLLPTVENAISGNAFRPGDILKTYQGTTVEIGNTDAEGRLILADALALASEESPDLMLDFATLTGAARIALGVALPAMFANSKALAESILAQGESVGDPVWQLPLHAPYKWQIKSKVADLNNAGYGPFNGAIYAALFLQEFVGETIDWAHFDLMAWNTRKRPGHPVGGDCPSLCAVYRYLEQRFRK